MSGCEYVKNVLKRSGCRRKALRASALITPQSNQPKALIEREGAPAVGGRATGRCGEVRAARALRVQSPTVTAICHVSSLLVCFPSTHPSLADRSVSSARDKRNLWEKAASTKTSATINTAESYRNWTPPRESLALA
ncbi:hypothetical protein EVAR_17488_1 [Eumeta japonica]|uniref:Uncharacterized protein n=1 Tax=Eumeta variegata TaxID=151549 RepID=A0A4C1ZJL0_EUMVA|nr:hypothetical protein EVAR_17488_1 [Eumeta japonica]